MTVGVMPEVVRSEVCELETSARRFWREVSGAAASDSQSYTSQSNIGDCPDDGLEQRDSRAAHGSQVVPVAAQYSTVRHGDVRPRL